MERYEIPNDICTHPYFIESLVIASRVLDRQGHVIFNGEPFTNLDTLLQAVVYFCNQQRENANRLRDRLSSDEYKKRFEELIKSLS